MIINDIFNSIDGEVNQWGQGRLSTFVRFAGCNLRCPYCDTLQARDVRDGTYMAVNEVIADIEWLGCRKVTITGGEPLVQRQAVIDLVASLKRKKASYLISVETNGSLLIIPHLDVNWVVDYKLDSQELMIERSFMMLKATDVVKFVVQNYEEAKQAFAIMDRLRFDGLKARLALSPDLAMVKGRQAVEWLQLNKQWDVQLNIQLHKIINIK